MALAKLILFLLRQLMEMVSIAKVALPVLVCTADPHVGGCDNTQDLERNACRNTGNVLGPILGGEDDSRDNPTQLAN
jgi:hypothetical protein